MNSEWSAGYDIQCGTHKIVENSNPSITISPSITKTIVFSFKYAYSIPPKALATTIRY